MVSVLQSQVKTLSEKENLTLEEAQNKFLSNFHPSGSPVAIEHVSVLGCMNHLIELCDN